MKPDEIKEREALTAQIAAAKAELREFDAKCRTERRARERTIKQLVHVRDQLTRRRPRKALDAHAQAGTGNIERMRESFRKLGVATAAKATAAAGYPAGHQVWAIRALAEDGVIRPTGRKEGRSMEYEYVEPRKGVTRLAPGE